MYSLPDQITKAITNIFDKFDDQAIAVNGEAQLNDKDVLDDSTLYLSSNWSTGEGGCIAHFDMFEQRE